jgi:hypothetical protein
VSNAEPGNRGAASVEMRKPRLDQSVQVRVDTGLREGRGRAAPLEALGVPFEPLKIAKGHDPPSQESLDFGPGFDGVDGIDPSYPD